mmetsp:Transcript_66023/g.137553  ORF Transcript_66023/g.137553 Transcript_66023/m.137553 type:complete len:203 (+) Transcript_66023:704-1312(+)
MRMTNDSPGIPILSSCAATRSLNLGITRSASAWARPHRGNAGQAMLFLVMASISLMSFTPWLVRICWTSALSLVLMPQMTTFWLAVRRRSDPYLSTMVRRAVLSLKLPSSLTRPCSTLTPTNQSPSPCGCQPSQSIIRHSGRGIAFWNFFPKYCSARVRKLSMPSVCTRYLRRAFARTCLLPWSRCAARIAFMASVRSSLSM